MRFMRCQSISSADQFLLSFLKFLTISINVRCPPFAHLHRAPGVALVSAFRHLADGGDDGTVTTT